MHFRKPEYVTHHKKNKNNVYYVRYSFHFLYVARSDVILKWFRKLQDIFENNSDTERKENTCNEKKSIIALTISGFW